MPDDDHVDKFPMLSIDSLVIDPHRYQMRAEVREDVAEEEYAPVLEKLPPPKAGRLPDGRKIVFDGFHYLHAAKSLDRRMVPVDLRDARDENEVFLWAVQANAEHGLRRTDADKRRAVRAMFAHPVYGQWTNRSIAQQANVSSRFVDKEREKWDEEARKAEAKKNGKAPKPKPQKRIGADGKRHPAKKRKKAGRVVYDVKKLEAPYGQLVRAVDDLYRAFGRVTARGGVAKDEEYEAMASHLRAFRDAFRQRYQELTKEPMPEE